MKSADIPVTNEQPIVLSGSVPSGGGGGTPEVEFYSPDYSQTGVDGIGFSENTKITVRFPDEYTWTTQAAINNIGNIAKTVFFNNISMANDKESSSSALANDTSISNFVFGGGSSVIGSYTIFCGVNINVFIPKTTTEIHENAIETRGHRSKLYYEGTETEWNNITGKNYIDANVFTIIFNATVEDMLNN